MFNAEAAASDRAQFEEEATQYVSDFKLTPSGEKYSNPLTFAMFMGWRLGKKTSGAAPSSAGPPDSADYWRQVAAKLGVELHKLKSLDPSSAGPGDVWSVINHERGLLIDKQIAKKISPLEVKKLEALNAYADAHLE